MVEPGERVVYALAIAGFLPRIHSNTAHVSSRSSSLYLRICSMICARNCSSLVSVARMNWAIDHSPPYVACVRLNPPMYFSTTLRLKLGSGSTMEFLATVSRSRRLAFTWAATPLRSPYLWPTKLIGVFRKLLIMVALQDSNLRLPPCEGELVQSGTDCLV